MILIGHRGAGGIEPENTIAAIEAAVNVGVDIIEFDLRATKDRQLVLVHDSNLLRIAGTNKTVSDMTLAEISTTVTKSGQPIPTFAEALEAAGKTPLLLDCKGKNWAKLLHEALKKHKGPTPLVTAIDTAELLLFAKLDPDIETYVSELTNPFEAVYKTKLLGFTGLSLNFWVLSPLVYWYAKRNKKKFMIFTVDNLFLARFLHLLYPSAAIISNVPDKLMPIKKHCRHKTS
ncbi:MAG: glycerophosphodiester phosphodiesterase [Candidatus Saccharimonadales bacterium]